jgi:D-amino-acid dehydrogenase
MKVIVLGAGIIGTATAWFLSQEGHEVTVVDRQPDAGLETTYANGAQISVCFCEPWANASAPFKVAKWLLKDDAPLLFRPHLDPYQWRWGLKFLTQCTDAAFARNVQQLVALGMYSHAALKESWPARPSTTTAWRRASCTSSPRRRTSRPAPRRPS